MLPRPKEAIQYNPSGRESVITRMKLLYGENAIVIKCKATAKTAITMQNQTMTPDQYRIIFSRVAYPDWAGEPNILDITARLVAVEINKATVYLVFLP
jgi:hypothetical protein